MKKKVNPFCLPGITSALMPCAASISAASSEVPTIFEKVTIDTSVPATMHKERDRRKNRGKTDDVTEDR